jgi:hypothetical protein
MHVATYIGMVHNAEQQLAKAFRETAAKHKDEPDIEHMCELLASWSDQHEEGLRPFIQKYSEDRSSTEPERLESLFNPSRTGSMGMLRNLHDLWLLTQEVSICWKVILQAARALRDKELESSCTEFQEQTYRQAAWLQTRIKQAAPQTLVVA